MSNIFHQMDADTIEIVATSAISSNDLIEFGGKVGVALADAAIGEAVNIRLAGAIRANKGALSYTMGTELDAAVAPTNAVAASGAGDVLNGFTVIADADTGDATVLVKIN